jgi:ABC-2 type transport system ATP-binding protein
MTAHSASEAGKSAPGTIVADGLMRCFGAVVAVKPFHLEIGPGGVTGLLGPNGSGKSTLMRMLLGLVRPDAGRACVDGVVLAGDGTTIRRRVTYTPGEIAVYGEMRAGTHLRWLLRGREPDALERAVTVARRFDLPLERRVRGFSHGMKRILLLSAALAPRVRVRILDEPTEGLDPSRRGQVLDLLEEDARAGTTILLSSHHLGEVDRTCERMLFLKEGELLDEESTRRIHLRARRALRIGWERPIDGAHVGALLSPLGELHLREQEATLLLADSDPRPVLAKLVADRALPEPASLTYGELSLQELYRELYGTEGV